MAVVLGLALLLFTGLLIWQAKTGPRGAYGRIRLGMTQDEVETVIGMPPRDYMHHPFIRGGTTFGPFGKFIRMTGIPYESTMCDPTVGRKPSVRLEHWYWDDYWIQVGFDEDGKVVGFYLLEVEDCFWGRPIFLDRVLDFLKL